MTPRPGPLACLPTPLHEAPALAEVLGTGELWLKRDDLTGFGFGGNKVRTADHVLDEAARRRVTTLIVCGGATSNFAATIALAGAVRGVAVHQVAAGAPPAVEPAALRIGRAAGARVTFTGSPDRNSMDAVAADLAADLGPGSMVVPRGGADEIGARGFAAAAREVIDQMRAISSGPARIVVPVGSGGSIAGLLAGAPHDGPLSGITGVAVSRDPSSQRTDIEALAARVRTEMGDDGPMVPFDLVDGRRRGFGVGDPETDAVTDRVRRGAGLLIDTTYNAKALTWLASAPRTGEPTIYWFTGGLVDALAPFSTPERSESP